MFEVELCFVCLRHTTRRIRNRAAGSRAASPMQEPTDVGEAADPAVPSLFSSGTRVLQVWKEYMLTDVN